MSAINLLLFRLGPTFLTRKLFESYSERSSSSISVLTFFIIFSFDFQSDRLSAVLQIDFHVFDPQGHPQPRIPL